MLELNSFFFFRDWADTKYPNKKNEAQFLKANTCVERLTEMHLKATSEDNSPLRRFNSFRCCDSIMQISSSMAVRYQQVGGTVCLLKTAVHVHVPDNGGDSRLSRLLSVPLQPTDAQTALFRPRARVRSDRENNWTTNVNYVIHFNLLLHSWHVRSAPLRVFKSFVVPLWLTSGGRPVTSSSRRLSGVFSFRLWMTYCGAIYW